MLLGAHGGFPGREGKPSPWNASSALPLSAEPGFVIPGGCGEVRAGIILCIAKRRTLSCMKANGTSHDT
jgi:hypothetical protein